MCNIMSKCHNILPRRTSFYFSKPGKVENVVQSETFRVAVYK